MIDDLRIPSVLTQIKQNTEVVKITRGLVYHYGVVPHMELYELVEKYSTHHLSVSFYLNVLFDAIECYQEIHVDKAGYTFWQIHDSEEVLGEQLMRPTLDLYPFTKQQLLEAGEFNYVEQPKGTPQLLNLLVKEYGLTKQNAIELIEEVVFSIKKGDHPSQILSVLQQDIEFQDLESVQKIMDVLMILINHTRQWYIKGYYPLEVRKQEESKAKHPQLASQQRAEVISIQTGRKVGRNDACPCGSGKKFKKCCGS